MPSRGKYSFEGFFISGLPMLEHQLQSRSCIRLRSHSKNAKIALRKLNKKEHMMAGLRTRRKDTSKPIRFEIEQQYQRMQEFKDLQDDVLRGRISEQQGYIEYERLTKNYRGRRN